MPASVGEVVIEGCSGLAGSVENCQLITNGIACADTPCAKLAVIFTGGDQGTGMTDVLAGHAALGWAAIAINVFETPEAAGNVPYLDEQARYDLAVREATTGEWARTYWTGEQLLFEGISHGATAPFILMAHTTLDDAAHWNGTGTTAGCFFDGSYDQAATAALLSGGAITGEPCTSPVSYDRWLQRYCGAGSSAGSCDLAAEPAAILDTIVGADPEAFAILDLRMIECGSSTLACTGDIIPSQPIEELCNRIDADATHTCLFDALPELGHLECYRERYGDCLAWFDELPPR